MNADTRRLYEKLLCHYKNLFTHHQVWLNHCKEVMASLEKNLAEQECTLTPDGKVVPVPNRNELEKLHEPGQFVGRGDNLIDWRNK